MSEEFSENIVVRYPPSPTGKLHVGNVRTMLFNYLFAEKFGGKKILRIEDTDKERSKKEYEDYIIESLNWLGVTYDEFYRQSDRTDIYEEHLRRLVDEGKAYVSEEDEGESKSVIRIKNPGGSVAFDDIVYGRIERDIGELGDFIIAKDFKTPLYHIAVVIDDALMGVTHVIRGQDHIPNTPRQIILQEMLGFGTPKYAHLPHINGPDGKKLSKRNGDTPTLSYRDKGYLPEAFINFLAFLGWNPKDDDKEIFSREELIAEFSLENVQRSSAVFNEKKLDWFNREHIKRMNDGDFRKVVEGIFEEFQKDFNRDIFEKILIEVKSRTVTFKKLKDMVAEGEFDYFFMQPSEIDISKIPFKNSSPEIAKKHLLKCAELIRSIDDSDWSAEKIKEVLFGYADEEGRGDVLWPLRYALSGRDKSADPFTIIYAIGADDSVGRIMRTVERI